MLGKHEFLRGSRYQHLRAIERPTKLIKPMKPANMKKRPHPKRQRVLDLGMLLLGWVMLLWPIWALLTGV